MAFRVYALEFQLGCIPNVIGSYVILPCVLISVGFWWLALHEFKKFQFFVIFELYKNQGCYSMSLTRPEVSASKDYTRHGIESGESTTESTRLTSTIPLTARVRHNSGQSNGRGVARL